MLNIEGRVLPATLGVVRLCARTRRRHDRRRRVEHLSTRRARSSASSSIRPRPTPLDEVIAAIRDADAIVLGPGLALHLDPAELAGQPHRARNRGRARA